MLLSAFVKKRCRISADKNGGAKKMGLMDTLQNQMDNKRTIQLQSPMELDELFSLLKEKVNTELLGEPVLKKGLTGKAIVFPKTSRVTPRITVKGNVVTVQKIIDSSTTTVGVGGIGFALDKDMRGKNALNTMDAGADYFKTVALAVEDALTGR